jgi:MYXO-CTERM domain-containing protein
VGLARVAGVTLGLGVWLATGTASAFCRTTTCDVDNAQANCTWDSNNCATSGAPLFWPSSCGWFGVQKDGSPLRKITYDTLHAAVVNAFHKWSVVDCGGGRVPSFEMQDTDVLYGPVECANHEFNNDKNKVTGNASAWMFRDGGWPYVGSTTTIALTTLSVEISTGRILDADVEINSFGTNITTSDTNVGADLESVVTHEAGHFLGLAHSAVRDATMFANYSPSSISIRNLSVDDEQAICTAYPAAMPPTCGPPEPIYGFSKYCGGVNRSTLPVGGSSSKSGCAVGTPRVATNDTALAALLVAGAATLRRRRRQRVH